MEYVPEAIFTHTSLLWITPDIYGYPLPSHHVLINIHGPLKSVTTNGNHSHALISLPKRCSCSPGQMPTIDIKFQTPQLIADALPV
jgi:hypothetical protein